MSNIFKLLIIFIFSIFLQSCGGLAAGIINRQIINYEKDEWASMKVKEYDAINLTEEQEKITYDIYFEEIEKLKENARKEKTKEISNRSSLNTLQYEVYKGQAKFEKLLTPEQLLEFRSLAIKNEINAMSEKEMNKERKKLLKLGYNVVF